MRSIKAECLDRMILCGDSSLPRAKDPHVNDLPQYEDLTSLQEVLEEFWPTLFEAMLAGWLRDPDCWPQKRSFEMFQEWFEIQMSTVAEDLYSNEPLESVEQGACDE